MMMGEMRVDVGKFLLEKLHEFLLLLGSCWSFLVEKLAEVFSPVEKIQHVGKFLLEKLHEFVHLFENFCINQVIKTMRSCFCTDPHLFFNHTCKTIKQK